MPTTDMVQRQICDDAVTPPFAPVNAERHVVLAEQAALREEEALGRWETIYGPFDEARPAWEDLTPEEQHTEIRDGLRSPYFDDFADDPTVTAHCARHGAIVLTAEGNCDQCGHARVKP